MWKRGYLPWDGRSNPWVTKTDEAAVDEDMTTIRHHSGRWQILVDLPALKMAVTTDSDEGELWVAWKEVT